VNLEGLTEKWSKNPIESKRVKFYENAVGDIVYKVCTKCCEVKSVDEFGKNKACLGGRNSACKNCKSTSQRKNYAADPEKYAERSRKKYAANTENYRERDRKRRENNPEYIRNWRRENPEYSRKYHEANRERKNEASRKWRIDNPERAVIQVQRRRARKSSLPDNFTPEQMASTFEYFGGCALTGDTANVQWDHVIPIATGYGGTTYNNMIPLRADLNLTKHTANLFEWFNANRQRFNLEQERFDRLIEWLGKANGMTVEEYRAYVYECHANPNEI
jgi:hypothetical protein